MPNFISKQTPEDSHPAGKLQFGTSVGLLDNIDTNNNNSNNKISILDTQQIMNEWFNNCYILSNNHVNNNITENDNQSIMICDLLNNKFFLTIQKILILNLILITQIKYPLMIQVKTKIKNNNF